MNEVAITHYTKEKRMKGSPFVVLIAESYPCFDSSDYMYEDRYYHNYYFTTNKTKAERIVSETSIGYEGIKKYPVFYCQYEINKMEEYHLPYIYYRGEGDTMQIVQNKKAKSEDKIQLIAVNTRDIPPQKHFIPANTNLNRSYMIPDENVPIVTLIGAPASGKTMTIVRLYKYLLSQGYKIGPASNYYEKAYNQFLESLKSNQVFPATAKSDFLLLEVVNNQNKTVCYLFDFSGDYFDTYHPIGNYPSSLLTLFTSPNPKCWIYVLDSNAQSLAEPLIVEHILYCRQHFYSPKKDKSILLYNKIDKTSFMVNSHSVDLRSALATCKANYSLLFSKLPKQNIFTKLLFGKKYEFDFLPFTTGFYTYTPDDKYLYHISHDDFPKKLWSHIGYR